MQEYEQSLKLHLHFLTLFHLTLSLIFSSFRTIFLSFLFLFLHLLPKSSSLDHIKTSASMKFWDLFLNSDYHCTLHGPWLPLIHITVDLIFRKTIITMPAEISLNPLVLHLPPSRKPNPQVNSFAKQNMRDAHNSILIGPIDPIFS